MNSHFFYPTASGSLGEARRLGREETIVKRESEDPPPQSSGRPFDSAVRSNPTISMGEDNDDGLHSDSRDDLPNANEFRSADPA
jgi:hypothetical protein